MWDDEDETRAPMTDAEYAVWHAETKAKIARSLADPRPAIPADEAFARLRLYIEALYLPDDAAA